MGVSAKEKPRAAEVDELSDDPMANIRDKEISTSNNPSSHNSI